MRVQVDYVEASAQGNPQIEAMHASLGVHQKLTLEEVLQLLVFWATGSRVGLHAPRASADGCMDVKVCVCIARWV